MSFGKRLPSAPSRPVEVETPSEPRRRETRGSPPKTPSLMLIAGFIAGLVAIFGGGYVYVKGMRQMGHALDQQFETQMSDALAGRRTSALTAQSGENSTGFGSCTLEQASWSPQAMQSAQNERGDPMLNKIKSRMGGDESENMQARSRFIDCVATSEVARLCNADTRKAFVADVAKFYGEYDFLSKNMMVMPGAAKTEKFAEIMTALQDAHPDVAGSINSVADDIAGAKEMVDQALHSAAQAGYISAGDFGFFGSSAAKAAMSDVKTEAQPCS